MKTHVTIPAQAETPVKINPQRTDTGGELAAPRYSNPTDTGTALTLQRFQSMANNAPAGIQSKQQVEMMAASPAALTMQRLQNQAGNSPQALQLKAHARAGIMSTVGAVSMGDATNCGQREVDEGILQGKFEQTPGADVADTAPMQRAETPNNTGLPKQLRSGIKSLSGMNVDHVEVHYNSDRPAQLQADAYAQGSEIHVAPGQEQHLPHEAWHVVQQAQGRVRPTMQMKRGVMVNDDQSLEDEADVMGQRAQSLGMGLPSSVQARSPDSSVDANPVQREARAQIIQMKWYDCFLACLPWCRTDPNVDAEPLLNASLGSEAADSAHENEVGLEFKTYLNSADDDLALHKACTSNSIGGVCTALTVDWFSQIAKGGHVHANPLSSQSELSRLVKEHKRYREIAIADGRTGMGEYMKTRKMERVAVKDGEGDSEVGIQGWIDEKNGIGELEFVELTAGGMYMIDFNERGGEGSAHTIGLYAEPNGGIIIRDQNSGQHRVTDMGELSKRYSEVMMDLLKDRRAAMDSNPNSDPGIPFYREWRIYKVSALP